MPPQNKLPLIQFLHIPKTGTSINWFLHDYFDSLPENATVPCMKWLGTVSHPFILFSFFVKKEEQLPGLCDGRLLSCMEILYSSFQICPFWRLLCCDNDEKVPVCCSLSREGWESSRSQDSNSLERVLESCRKEERISWVDLVDLSQDLRGCLDTLSFLEPRQRGERGSEGAAEDEEFSFVDWEKSQGYWGDALEVIEAMSLKESVSSRSRSMAMTMTMMTSLVESHL
jgi:hypothetical protein